MAQVKVGDNPATINNASLFEMESTTRGVLFPRMTLAQRAAITNPPEGLVIFQTDNTPGFYYNASSIPVVPNWKQLITPDAQYWYRNGNNMYPNTAVTGNIGIGTTTPLQAGLVVDRKAGAVNAMFGSNTTGVAIETSYPGIALNTYYNAGRKFINNGYGGLVGLNPVNGNLSLYVTANDGAADATATLSEALTIIPNGNLGVGTTAPVEQLQVAGNARIDGLLKINGNPGTAGQFLVSNGFAAPTWQTVNVPNAPRGIRVGLAQNEGAPDNTRVSLNFMFVNDPDTYNTLPGLDALSGIFTCPENGLYQITVHIGWGINGAFTGDKYFETYLYRSVGASGLYVVAENVMLAQYNNVSSTRRTQELNVTLKLSVGDRLQVQCEQRSGAGQLVLEGGALTYWNITKLN
jgi:hypothetical protein